MGGGGVIEGRGNYVAKFDLGLHHFVLLYALLPQYGGSRFPSFCISICDPLPRNQS